MARPYYWLMATTDEPSARMAPGSRPGPTTIALIKDSGIDFGGTRRNSYTYRFS